MQRQLARRARGLARRFRNVGLVIRIGGRNVERPGEQRVAAPDPGGWEGGKLVLHGVRCHARLLPVNVPHDAENDRRRRAGKVRRAVEPRLDVGGVRHAVHVKAQNRLALLAQRKLGSSVIGVRLPFHHRGRRFGNDLLGFQGMAHSGQDDECDCRKERGWGNS